MSAEIVYGNLWYHGQYGLCCTDADGNFVLDGEGKPIRADKNSGRPLDEIERCPHCGAVRKKRRQ